MFRKVLPRFLKKKGNSLAFFRKTTIINALKNNQILLFFPTFNFLASQWLWLRRDLFFKVSEVQLLAGASSFHNYSPLFFSSTLTHFIVSIPNINAFSKVISFLSENPLGGLPTIVFSGANCLNLYPKGFMVLAEIFADQPGAWFRLVHQILGVTYLLTYVVLYFSYFCLIVFNTLSGVLLGVANCCVFFKS